MIKPPYFVLISPKPFKSSIEHVGINRGVNTGEIAYRYVQNIGADPLYYSFQVVDASVPPKPLCDNVATYHGVLTQYAQLNCSNHRLLVTGYSVNGTTVALTVIRRKDMTH